MYFFKIQSSFSFTQEKPEDIAELIRIDESICVQQRLINKPIKLATQNIAIVLLIFIEDPSSTFCPPLVSNWVENYNNHKNTVQTTLGPVKQTFRAYTCNYFHFHQFKHVFWVLGSFEYPQHMFWLKTLEKLFSLIWRL